MVKKTVKRTPKCVEKIADERFQGRLDCLMRKTHEIGAFCDSEVYLVLHRRNRYYTYKTKTSPTWPPSEQQINESRTDAIRRTPADYRSTRRIKFRSPPNSQTSNAEAYFTSAEATRFEEEISSFPKDQLDTDRPESLASNAGPSTGPRLLESHNGDEPAVQQRPISPAVNPFFSSDTEVLQVLDEDTGKLQDLPLDNHLLDPSSGNREANIIAPHVSGSYQPSLCSVFSNDQDNKSGQRSLTNGNSGNNLEDENFWAENLFGEDYSFADLDEPMVDIAGLDCVEVEAPSFAQFLEDLGTEDGIP